MKKSENEALKEKLDEIIRENAERNKSLEKILRELSKKQKKETI